MDSEERKDCMAGLKIPPDEMIPKMVALLTDNGYDCRQSIALWAAAIEYTYKAVLEKEVEVTWQPRER